MAKAETHKQAKVSIIIPVYGDWPSLGQCIDSLIEHLDPKHTVLLVNDCGPDVDLIEHNIKQKIKGQPNFRYERNVENLGFVGTCNRAVFELDNTDNDILLLNSDTMVTAGFLEEMQAVMAVIDRHGVVVPRSNNATLATVPLRQLFERPRDDLEYAYATYQKIKDRLPRFNVVPVGPGFCMLIRRQLIRNYSLFDTVYGKGYNEENDFCLRINKYGYSSVVANHAFVYHLESKSFPPDLKLQLNLKNNQTLLQRYPFYTSIVKRYFTAYIDPVDHFADAIVHRDKIKILINLFHFPLAYNGSTKNGLSFLRYIKAQKLDEQYDITILCHKEAERYHGLRELGLRIVYPDTIGEEIFHISYCPSQIFHVENLLINNHSALQSVFGMLDIISLRSQYLLAKDLKQRAVFLDSLRWADSVITISDFAQKDIKTYFSEYEDELADKLLTIHEGYPGVTFADTPTDSTTKLPPEPYVLVFGNDYSHKAIKETLPQLEIADVQAVIIGPRSLKSNSSKIKILPSGNIPDNEIERLLEGCSAVVFPSQYEGFGLPLLEAAHHGKPVLYYASEVGDEIAGLIPTKSNVESFEQFDEIPAKLQTILSKKNSGKAVPVRTIESYNAETWEHIVKLAAQPYADFDFLRQRWEHFALVRDYFAGGGTPPARFRHRAQQRLVRQFKKYPIAYHKTRKVYRRLRKIPD